MEAIGDNRKRSRLEKVALEDIYSNSRNFYPQTGIEEKKRQILATGLLENLVVTEEKNPFGPEHYKLISGERRWRALKQLVEEGHSDYEQATCNVIPSSPDDNEVIQLVISNSHRTKDLYTELVEEKTVLDALKRIKKNNGAVEGYDISRGRLRDVAAEIVGISSSKAALIEAINNNLDESYVPYLKQDNNGLTITYLYAMSTQDKETQRKFLANWRATGIWGNVKLNHKKEDAPVKQEPLPFDNEEPGNAESSSDDKYDAENYEEPAGTKPASGSQVESPSVEKTEEQLYDEAEKKIDRETNEKLREMGITPDTDKKAAKTEPASENADEYGGDALIKVSPATFGLLASKKQPYIILKTRKPRTNDKIVIAEMADGKLRDGRIEAEIICIDNSDTSSAVNEGYTIAGLSIISVTGYKEDNII